MGTPVPAADLPVSRAVPYDDLPNPTFSDTAKEALKGAGKNLLGIGENIANQATQLGALTVTAIPNIIGSTGAELAESVVKERMPTFKGISDKFHANIQPQIYQPQTESGQRQVEATGKVMTAIPAAVDAVDAAYGDPFKRNFPNAYAATQVAGEFAPWIIGGKALHAPAKPELNPRPKARTVPVDDIPPEQPQAETEPPPRQEAPKQEQAAPEPEPEPFTPPPSYTTGQEPFSATRLQAEIQLAQNPDTSKAAVELPQNSPLTSNNIVKLAQQTGMGAVKVDGVPYLYNPAKTTAKAVRESVANDTKGHLLGYGTERVPETGVDYAVSTDGRGTTDLPTIKEWRDTDTLAFAGRALNDQMAAAKMQEMGAKEIAAQPQPEGEVMTNGQERRREEVLTDSPQVQGIPDTSEGRSSEPAGEPIPSDVWANIYDSMTAAVNNSFTVVKGKGKPATDSTFTKEFSQQFPSLFYGADTSNPQAKYNKRDVQATVKNLRDGKVIKSEIQKEIAQHITDDVNNLREQERYAAAEAEMSDTIDTMTPEERSGALDDFMAFMDENFGGEDVQPRADSPVDETAGRAAQPDNTGDAAAPRTESIDSSGWGQQVGIEGDTRRTEFGSRGQQGRNVGLSEFMDGFTPDPQQDLFSGGTKGNLNNKVTVRMEMLEKAWPTQEKRYASMGKELPNKQEVADFIKGEGEHPRNKDLTIQDIIDTVSDQKEYNANRKQPFQGSANGNSHADTGGYSRRPSAQPAIQLPEILRVAKALLNGELPRLKEKIADGVLGRFWRDKNNPEDRGILLRKDIFTGPLADAISMKPAEMRGFDKDGWKQAVIDNNPGEEIIFKERFNKKTGNTDLKAYIRDRDMAAKVLAHEIGHAKDYLPDYMVRGRGNIFGHIAALKMYMKHTLTLYKGSKEVLTDSDKARIRRAIYKGIDAPGDLVTLVTKDVPVYESVGITPDMITEIWNGIGDARTNYPDLYKFIASMSDSEKKSVVVQAIKGVVDEKVAAITERKQVGVERTTEVVYDPSIVKQKVKDAINAEMNKRRLYKLSEINQELKDLTQYWKPFDESMDANYTKYRYSPAELYADAVSVLFNEPASLKSIAPNFYKAMLFYMGERPQFRDAYKAVAEATRDPQALFDMRQQAEREMVDKGNAKANEMRAAQKDADSIMDTIKRTIIDKNHDILKQLDNTPEEREVRNDLEELPYVAGEASEYVRQVVDITNNLEAEGLTKFNLHEYLRMKHVIEARDPAGIASAGGYDAVTARQYLEGLREQIGDRGMALLDDAAQKFADIREYVIKRMADSWIVDFDFAYKALENRYYAHQDVQKYMDQRYGNGSSAGAGWKKLATGNLDDINNVFVATVLQDLSILRMAKVNEAKLSVVNHFVGKGLSRPAEMKFDLNSKGMRPVEPRNKEERLFTVLRNGKPEHYVVDRHVADVFQYDPVRAQTIGKAIGYVMTFLRDILVSKNPAWMARNIYRDTKGTMKNNPEVAWWNPADRLRLLREYKRATADIWNYQMKGIAHPDITRMYQDKMLAHDRAYAAKDTHFEDELARLSHEFQFGSEESANIVARKAKQLYEYLDRLGKVSEQSSKLAGMRFLESKGVNGPELAHRVRTSIGTPDFKRQGSLQWLTNNLFLFSNVGKEGIRTAVSAFKRDPMSYIFKTVESNVLPKLMLAGAAAGLFGDKLKEWADAIPTWVRRTSNVVPLPDAFVNWAKKAGIAGEKDVAYLKLPQDYEGQFWGALTYDMLEGNIKDMAQDVGSVLPYSPDKLLPPLKLAWDWFSYVSGQNPTDTFRHKPVLTKEQEKYLETQGPTNAKSLTGMGKHTYNMLGIGNVYRLENREFPQDQATQEKAFKQLMRYLGGYVEFTDAGKQEQVVKSIVDTRNAKAIQSYEVGDRINDAVREGKTSSRDVVDLYRNLAKEGIIDPRKTRIGEFQRRVKATTMQKDYGIKPTSREEARRIKALSH